MIKKFRSQSDELYLLRRKVYLNFVALDCLEVNGKLQRVAEDLANRLVEYMISQNRDLNRR